MSTRLRPPPKSFQELIDGWAEENGQDCFAEDLGQKPGTVRVWKHRNRVPREHWALLLTKAPTRRLRVTYEDLVAMEEAAA